MIRYGMPTKGRVTLKIYDSLGKEIASLSDNEQKAAGYHLAIWNGRDEAGHPAASGIYFVRILAEHFVQTRKILLIR
jgi:flagellar hook assembly protein FlgD